MTTVRPQQTDFLSPTGIAAEPPKKKRSWRPDFLSIPDDKPDPQRASRLAAMLTREKWTVPETAYFMRRSEQHVINLIVDGSVIATNGSRDRKSRPNYRVLRDSVLAFEKTRLEGAGDAAGSSTTRGK